MGWPTTGRPDSLLVLFEVVLLPESCLCLFILMGEVVLPARAEVNVPAPEPAFEGLGILVVGRAELAVLAGIGLLCHRVIC